MIRRCIIHIQRILFIVILLLTITTSYIIFPDMNTITTDEPIINATMYANYPNLWVLDMSNQTRFEFPVDQVLLIHDELSRFVCHNCGVKSIYRASLSKLPLLTHVLMENNSLQYIHPDAFEYNARLEKVDLAGNQLTTINPEATIRNIPGLTMLDLSWNEHFDLNKVKLQARRLMFLTCNHCHTTFLNQATFSTMPRLSQLYLSHNKLQTIDHDALAAAKYMKTLNVSRNRNLKRLNLKSDALNKLCAEGCSLEGTLDTSQLPLLEYINVRANRIIRIDEHGFMQKPFLKNILLDDNLIEKVPTFLLELPLNNLKQLCMDRNPLQPSHRVDEAKMLYATRELRNGCLDDSNHLNQFEHYLPNLKGLAVYKKNPIHGVISSDGRTVDLSDREIVYIEPDYLMDEKNVTDVIFDNNHSFDFKQKRIFLKNSNVEQIFLKNCSITEIYETTFRELPKLKSLHLQGNRIKSIESSSLFTHNPDIAFLSLSHNNLEYIAARSFKQLPNLEVLNLDWNEGLTNSAQTPFLMSTSLRKLSCVHCHFRTLDSMTLAGLPNLLELNLEHNYISTVDSDALQSTSQLKYLNLRFNHLLSFEPNINQQSHLKTLCLGRNPNFELEHPQNYNLVENIQKMMQLDTACEDEKFSNELSNYNKKKRHAKNETEEVPKIEPESEVVPKHAALEHVKTSSTGRYKGDLVLSILLSFVILRYSYVQLSFNFHC